VIIQTVLFQEEGEEEEEEEEEEEVIIQTGPRAVLYWYYSTV